MQDSRAARGQTDHDGPARLARAKGMVSTAIGGGVAIALLITVGSWVWGLGTRDPSNVPIIRASTEPAKVRPDDPGGTNAPYQEISSYQLAGTSNAPTASTAYAPPPPEPRREDLAMGTLASTSGEAARAEPVAHEDFERADDVMPMEDWNPLEDAEPGADGFDEGLAIDAPSIPPAPSGDAITGGSDRAPSLSPVAPRRPSDLEQRMVSAIVAAERSAGELARRAAESAIQVQLAAEADEDVVRSMWQRISRANSDILHDRALAVQTTSSGGTTFYRLRVGPFGDVSEARAVCQALKARGQDCVVARNG